MHCCTWVLCATVHKEKVYVFPLKFTHTALVNIYNWTIRHFDCGDELERDWKRKFLKMERQFLFGPDRPVKEDHIWRWTTLTKKFLPGPKRSIYVWTEISGNVGIMEASDRKSPEEMSLMFSGKEVDFARSLFDKQHEFNGTSLEVNKIRQNFYLCRHAQQKFAFSWRSSRNKRRSLPISLNFYQTNLLSSPQSRCMFDIKKLLLIDAAKSHSRRKTRRPVENCDRVARKSTRLPSNSPLVIFTILFQVKVKR